MKPRFDRQNLRIVERRVLCVRIRREQQLGARVEQDAQLPARGDQVLSAKWMIRVIDVADNPSGRSLDRRAAHQPSPNDGPLTRAAARKVPGFPPPRRIEPSRSLWAIS